MRHGPCPAETSSVRLTQAAAERVKAVMAKADRPIAAVRVGVKNGGCAGMSYYMEYAEKIDPLDEVIEDKGVRIVIDRYPVVHLSAEQEQSARWPTKRVRDKRAVTAS